MRARQGSRSGPEPSLEGDVDRCCPRCSRGSGEQPREVVVTTVARTFVSVPERSATETWDAIVALIAPDSDSAARTELLVVAGVACSCIADEALASDPIIVHGVGPRLRVY